MTKLLCVVLFISLKGCSMSQELSTDVQVEKKIPTVSILPVGNPVPLPTIDTNKSELLKSNAGLQQADSTQEESNKGANK